MGIWTEGSTPAQITFRLASILSLLVFLALGGPTQLPRVQTVDSLLIVT